jgi:hypothetical protein
MSRAIKFTYLSGRLMNVFLSFVSISFQKTFRGKNFVVYLEGTIYPWICIPRKEDGSYTNSLWSPTPEEWKGVGFLHLLIDACLFLPSYRCKIPHS